MGLIKKYKEFIENRRQRHLEKSSKIVGNPKAVREDRVAAIDFFAGQENAAEAIPALLKRFEYSLEHGINDSREKDAAMEGIIRHGEAALPLLETHLNASLHIAWPIKMLKKVCTEDRLVRSLFSALDFSDVALDQQKVDKNYDLLCHLMEYKIPQSASPKKIAHFLTAHDERLRFAATEVLLEQEISNLSEMLEPFLLDDSSENTRIRQAVILGFIKNGWKIRDQEKLPRGSILPGARVTNDFILKSND